MSVDTDSVWWAELLPREFHARLEQNPTVYLPMGLAEPHGHAAAFGLDTFKAEWLCEQAARRFGGIVAPTQTWQIHETGYHRPWLQEVMDGANPRLGSLPPDLVLRTLTYQLRAFVNAGFRRIVVLTGHHGNQRDLRIVAEEVTATRSVPIIVVSDPELVRGVFAGDHAGRYELSQLMHVRPDLVDLSRVADAASPLGRFAQGDDAGDATAQHGREILEASLSELQRRLDGAPLRQSPQFLSLEETAVVWERVAARQDEWCTLREEDPDRVSSA